MKIGYDFDGTLGHNPAVKKLAKFMVEHGAKVYIITYRFEDQDNSDVLSTADELNIPRDHVFFCGEKLKTPVIAELGLDLYFDDDPTECHLINYQLSNKAVLVNYQLNFSE
jgi:hypothetical protein